MGLVKFLDTGFRVDKHLLNPLALEFLLRENNTGFNIKNTNNWKEACKSFRRKDAHPNHTNYSLNT